MPSRTTPQALPSPRAALALFALSLAGSGCATSAPAVAASRPGPPATFVEHHERGTWRERLVDPVSAPTTFESALIESNVEPILLAQSFPSDSIFDGGGFSVVAVQARFAVTDRLAIIATKDGWIQLDPDTGDDESGLADIAAGVKYAWIDDPESGVLVTPGITLELPLGDDDVFQDQGDGILRPFLSAAKDYGEVDLQTNVGYSFPFDDDEDVSSVDYHLHVSYEATETFSPLVEFNGITYTSDGDALPVDFEGGDLINLGAADVSGNTFFTAALGFRWRLTPHLLLGATYEEPLTSREDLMDSRLIVDLVVH